MGGETVGKHDLEEPGVERHDEVPVVDRWQLPDNQFGHRAKKAFAVQQVHVRLGQPVESQDLAGQQLEEIGSPRMGLRVTFRPLSQAGISLPQVAAGDLFLHRVNRRLDAVDLATHALEKRRINMRSPLVLQILTERAAKRWRVLRSTVSIPLTTMSWPYDNS